jgi:NAD(P) transhydrogenase subunit alpha
VVDLLLMLGFFAFSFGVGYLIIFRVPQMLHTPLMSMTNAISAVTLLGALLLFATPTSALEKILGTIAVSGAAFNMIGGFAITDRMVQFFKKRPPKASQPEKAGP